MVDDEQFDPHPEAMRFAVSMEGAEKSPNTIRTYMLAVAAFLTWAAADGVRWQSVNVLDLVRFKRHLQVVPSARTGRPRAPRTVSVMLTAVTEFLRFCAANGHIDAAIADRLVEKRWIQQSRALGRGEGGQFHRTRINALRVKVAERPPEVFSDEQVLAMREYAKTARDRFLLRVLHEGGPRIGETLGLLSEDIHLLPNSRALGCAVSGPHFHVRRRTDNRNYAIAKSKTPRHVPVADSFVSDYRDYQHERFTLLGDRQGRFLFVNYRGAEAGGPMTYSNAYQIVSGLGRKCGFRATPHMFRHSAATEWIAAGSEIDVVQNLLGHATSESTSIYIHASDARTRAAVAAVHAARQQGAR
ncbi:hypothetical protein AXK56_10700 [Tsukamurella pulmonis]|nr:hypothetical protein AXK56_10700 [Tsukamurella pulmonis]